MNEISKEILEKYQIRKTKKQKTEFIEFMRAHFPDLQIEEGGLGKNRNIVIGDLSTAKVLLGAHYDTCAVMPIPNFIMPKNLLVSFGYGFLLAIPMLIIAWIAAFVITFITDMPGVGSTVAMGVYFILLGLMFLGKPNKHTVNDNTSGVITLIEILSTMTEEEKEKTAFVFFDNEENGLLGSSFFAKKHKNEMKDKLMLNFDCVSDGDYIMLIPNKKAFPEYAEGLSTAFAPEENSGKTLLVESGKGIYYPSDQGSFKKSVGVAAFNKCRFGLYLDKIHTPKDTVMDEKNIELLVNGTVKFINEI